MHFKKLPVIALLLLTLIGTASAATYYLDAVNGDDANPGTSEAPWKTIDRAAPQAPYSPNVVSGDTVILRGGYYGAIDGTGDWDNSNTDWITYKAEDAGGDPPLFRQITISRSPNIDAYLSFDGIRFPWAVGGVGEVGVDRTYSTAVHIFGANHFKLLNCYIEGNVDLTNGTEGGKEGVGFYARSRTVSGIKDILIDNCEFTNLRSAIVLHDVGDPNGPENNGIIIRNSYIHHLYIDFIEAHSLSNSLIEDNEIGDGGIFGNNLIFDEYDTSVGSFVIGDTFTQANTGASGTFLYLDSDPTAYNVKGSYSIWDETEIVSSSGGTFTPSKITPQAYHSDLIQIYGDNAADQCVNITIRGNVFYNTFQGLLLKQMTNVLIENNLIYGWTNTGNVISLITDCMSGTIRHNTIVTLVDPGDGGGTQIAIRSNDIGGEVFNVYNNLISASLTLGPNAGETLNVYNNIIGTYNDYDGGSLPETNYNYHEYPFSNETLNAVFVDYYGGNYSPLMSSPACNGSVNPLGVHVGAFPCVPECSGTETRSCYTGPSGTEGVGICHNGTQTCIDPPGSWGSCTGEQTPLITEICGNGIDETCDGVDPICPPIVPEGYVAWWRFEGDTTDLTGNNDGTIFGNPQYVSGVNGTTGLKFDGDGDYVNVTNDTTIKAQRPMSVMAWVKRDAVGEYDYLFYKMGSGNKGWWLLIRDIDDIRFGFPGVNFVDSISTITDIQWHHIAVTIASEGNVNFYIDGVNAGTANLAAPIITSYPLRMGTKVNTSGTITDYSNFTIDEVMIYDRVLSTEEIQDIYLTQKTECVDTEALLGYISQWKQGSLGIVALMEKIGKWKAGEVC